MILDLILLAGFVYIFGWKLALVILVPTFIAASCIRLTSNRRG